MSEWQPIETAPSSPPSGFDAEPILFWVKDGGIKRSGAIVMGVVYQGDNGHRIISPHGYLGDFDVTHWMPLPEPPEVES